MEGVVVFGPCAYASLSSPSLVISARRNPNFSRELQKSHPARIVRARLWRSLLCLSKNVDNRPRSCDPVLYVLGDYRHRFFGQPTQRLDRKIAVQSGLFSVRNERLRKSRKYIWKLQKAIKYSENIRNHLSVLFVRHIVGMVLVMIISVAVSRIPSYALTEENLLFLEAWRTIDRAYVDKTFNGQSWFRYRENALRNEPMNTREETYKAIRKMLATLDDPFTRFLEPEKFKSLRLGTQSALTGVGLSIGYPTGGEGSPAGLVVISAAPGGPAKKAGISSGDVILKIDETSTETMGIYDAADRLQGSEGSSVELTIQSGPMIKHVSLTREKISLNPVQSRLCEVPGLGRYDSRVGYIKLTSFNQNASEGSGDPPGDAYASAMTNGAVREAIETLKGNNVNAFVLDLRDNSGGLFPEGIEIAKIWLAKGVIVYICDSQGVRDIYDTDGSNAVAATEPLAVLVNKGTASASEILAGALKDNKRAVLFGEPTYGKGKIQSVFELSDGSGLAVTVARYETPAHTDIDKVAMHDDIPYIKRHTAGMCLLGMLTQRADVVGVIPDHPLPASFPKDDTGFCSCLQDPLSACYFNRVELFSR